MRTRSKKVTALLMCATVGVSTMLTGCGGSKSSDKDTFTYMLSTPVSHSYYSEYEDNPVVQYWLDKEWKADSDSDGKKISIDFVSPASQDTAKDMANTLISTGEYTDIMDLLVCSESAAKLYDDGIAMDITEYVEKYMPNYQKWIKDNNYGNRLMNYVDGEYRYIQIYGLSDQESYMWGGLEYRRDWIVKYGKNPQTGTAFTGGYDADGNWSDDVVFPSGEVYPVYISDWEWMLDIFATALKEEGITDGYCMQMYYMGEIPTGEIETGFGIGSGSTYLDENGQAQYGGTSDGMRAYIECMHQWYENGWIDQDFEQRSSDMFFSLDAPTVYSGKCGLWWGTQAQLADGMATGEDDFTKGIYVAAAPQPINDKYGDVSCQNKVPTTFLSNAVVTSGIVITEKAKDKDLASLFTAIDYLFSEEGGMLKQYGFSDKQQAEIQSEVYDKIGMGNGTYTVSEDGTYQIDPKRDTIQDCVEVTSAQRLVGLAPNKNVDRGYPEDIQTDLELWSLYKNTGSIGADISNNIDADDAQDISLMESNCTTYSSTEIPKFIKGSLDITSDKDWKNYVKGLEEFNPTLKADCINKLLNQ